MSTWNVASATLRNPLLMWLNWIVINLNLNVCCWTAWHYCISWWQLSLCLNIFDDPLAHNVVPSIVKYVWPLESSASSWTVICLPEISMHAGFLSPLSWRPHRVTLLRVYFMPLLVFEKPQSAIVSPNFSADRGHGLVCRPSHSSFLSRLNLYRFYIDNRIVKQEEFGHLSLTDCGSVIDPGRYIH